MTEYMKLPPRDNTRPVALGKKVEFQDLVKVAQSINDYANLQHWWEREAKEILHHVVKGAPGC